MAHRKTSKRSKARTMLRLADLEQSKNAVGHHVRQLWRSCESRQINPTAIRAERVRQQRVADAENDPDRYAGVATAANGIRDPLRRANGNSDVRAAVE
jgi:hypothetical protein